MQWSTDDGRSDVHISASIDQQFDHLYITAQQGKVKWRRFLDGGRGKDVPSIGTMVQQQSNYVNVVAQNGVVQHTSVVVTFYWQTIGQEHKDVW